MFKCVFVQCVSATGLDERTVRTTEYKHIMTCEGTRSLLEGSAGHIIPWHR